MSISIEVNHLEKGKLSLRTDPHVTIETFKRQIATEYGGGHSAYYRLSLPQDKVVLQNDKDATVESCNICDKDEITVTDCEFLVTIQGPFPLCEVSSMQITRTTTVASIKENIRERYDYNSSKQFDLLYNGILLVNSNIEKHGITENDTLIVTERIVHLMETPKKKTSVATPPIFSPKLKKKSLSKYDSMMNTIMGLFSDGDGDTTRLRSCSMPDLIGNNDEDDSSNTVRNSFASRKISMPVFGNPMGIKR